MALFFTSQAMPGQSYLTSLLTVLVSNTVNDATGIAIPNVLVTVTLFCPTQTPTAPPYAFSINGIEISAPQPVLTDINGMWAISLVPLDSAQPHNLYYVVTENLPDGPRVYYVRPFGTLSGPLAKFIVGYPWPPII